jgi:hypothetical protein
MIQTMHFNDVMGEDKICLVMIILFHWGNIIQEKMKKWILKKELDEKLFIV